MADIGQLTEEDIQRLLPDRTGPIPGSTNVVNKVAPQPEIGNLSDDQITNLLGQSPFENQPISDPDFEATRARNTRGNQLNRVDTFISQNQQGIPIDATTGLGAGIRAELSFARTQEDKLTMLANRFKPENVRQTADGKDFLVKIPTPEGIKEFKVDEINPIGQIVGADLADLTFALPETAAGLAGIGASRLPRFAKGLAGIRRAGLDLTAGALGAQIEGGITDAGIRASQGRDIDLPEIAKSRAVIGAAEIATGAVLGTGAKLLMRAPFQSTDRVIINRVEAARRLERETGVPIVEHMTTGELTGSKLFRKAESLIGQMPGGKPLEVQKAASDASIARVQRAIVGGDSALTEDVGSEAIGVLQQRGIDVRDALVAAKREVVDEGTEEALQLLGQRNARPRIGSELGNAAKETAEFKKNDFRAVRNDLYEEAIKLAGEGKPVLLSKSLKTEAQKLLDELPQQRGKPQTPQHNARLNAQAELETVLGRKRDLIKLVSENAGEARPQSEIDELLALSDKANELKKALASTPEVLPTDVKGSKILHPFVDSEAVSMLEKIVEIGDQPFALREFIEMGRRIDTKISVGKAMGNTDDRLFTRMRNVIRDATREGLRGLKDNGKALEAFETANDFFAANRPQFDVPGVADFFKKDFKPDAFFKKLNAGATDEYNNLQKFFGKNSAQMEAIRSGMRNDIFQSSKIDGDLIDGNLLLNKLNAMSGLRKEVLRDVVGPHADDLMSVARRVKLAQGSKISQDQLDQLMITESKLLGISTINVEGAFKALVRAQRNLDREFSGQMMKTLAKGEIGDEVIDPGDFVNRWYDKASLSEVKKAMALFNKKDPQLAIRVQQKTLESLFLRSRSTAKGLPKLSGAIDEPLDVGKLQGLVPTEVERRKLAAIVGDDTVAVLDDFVDVLQGRAESSGGAGALGSSMVLTQAIRTGGILNYAQNFLSFKAAAILLKEPAFKKWFSNTLLSKEAQNRLLITALASAPFAEALANDMGPINARNAGIEFNRAISLWMEDNPEQAAALEQ